MFDIATIIVLIIRLIGPLIILWFPFVGTILSEYVFDVADAFIWNHFNAFPANYTIIDKRLDMFAFLLQGLMVRKWNHKEAKKTAYALFGIRLIGFILFEITGNQAMFFFFPNIFVMFFMIYYVLKHLKKEMWLSSKKRITLMLLLATALKMPQEYVLHYGRLITWDSFKRFLKI